MDSAFRLQLRFRDIGPDHHIPNHLFHIDDGRNEISPADQTVDPGIHAEECADAVCDQDDALVFRFQFFHRRADLRTGFPGGKGLIVQSEYLAIGEQRPVMLTLSRAAAFAVNVQHRAFHTVKTMPAKLRVAVQCGNPHLSSASLCFFFPGIRLWRDRIRHPI